MADIKYTEMQQAAIDLRDKNILVSAAAGSGKTAVLVERIIKRILDKEDPVDIDRILVMTFTRAAARQMKEKIIQAIDDRRLADPNDLNVQKQYVLVHNASIMTIDSFCLNVVRNHFEEIDLAPDFRMADEGEVRLIMQDVLEKLLEEKYEDGDAAFLRMTECFATGKDDDDLEKIILKLYNYAQSYPDPEKWLDECLREYHNECWDNMDVRNVGEISDEVMEKFENIPWIKSYVNCIRDSFISIRNEIEECIEICNIPYGPKPFEAAYLSDMEVVDKFINADSYSSLYNVAREYIGCKYATRASYTIPEDCPLSESEKQYIVESQKSIDKVRTSYKKKINDKRDMICEMSPKEVMAGMRIMSECTFELIEVTKDFLNLLKNEKQSKNIVDFNDLEHYCLDILKNGLDTTAKEYASFYREIYVDEYQDSNLCQEEILKYLTDECDGNDSGKLFMVGDNKQSIYGFRLARPQIFIDKYNRFADISKKDECRDIKIDLSDNFRSRNEVLDTVNDIFRKIMTKDVGGIEYNDRVKLNYGAKYIDIPVDNKSELMIINKGTDIQKTEAEAYMTALKIKELMKDFRVEENGTERPLKYSDIVILMRSPKGRDTVFLNIFENEGIPVHITSTQGYFSAAEIVILLEYLKVIDNPLQDIPFAGVMMSIIGGFTEEDLALVRAASDKKDYIYNACISYINNNGRENASLAKKLETFISELNHYRKRSEYCSVEEILTEIIDSDYGHFVRAMPGGEKKYANLNMLINKAKDYGKTSFKGIFHFNRYIEALKKYEIDYGEANTLDENDDTVRIMSIHKSKGLEFPVCFLCGVTNGLNLKDAESSVIIDSDYGFATDVVDVDRRIRTKSVFRLSVAEKKKNELIAEELRLLYVAMTRAKEKLILTGCIKTDSELSKKVARISDARSYMDFIKYALDKYDISLHNSEQQCDFLNISIKTVEDIVTDKTIIEAGNFKLRDKLLYMIDECCAGSNRANSAGDDAGDNDVNENNADSSSGVPYIEEIRRRMSFVYPHGDSGTAVKMSVSELKHKSDPVDIKDDLLNDENKVPYNTSGASFGALHGSAVHRIFELWDYNRDDSLSSVKDFLSYVKVEKLMEDDLYATLNADEIAAFVKSDVAKRMKEAYKNGTLRREQPFVISIDENDPESMLVQGIIDAYFIEDGEIVLVDYKTDKNKTETMLIQDHKTQLDYYAMALERMLGLPVKDKIIYSTELKKSIPAG